MRLTRLLFLAALCCLALNAQEVTAGIYGNVQDSTSAVVPNATVILHNVDTGRNYQTTSDQDGNYALTLIPVGNYEVYCAIVGLQKGQPTLASRCW